MEDFDWKGDLGVGCEEAESHGRVSLTHVFGRLREVDEALERALPVQGYMVLFGGRQIAQRPSYILLHLCDLFVVLF